MPSLAMGLNTGSLVVNFLLVAMLGMHCHRSAYFWRTPCPLCAHNSRGSFLCMDMDHHTMPGFCQHLPSIDYDALSRQCHRLGFFQFPDHILLVLLSILDSI